MEKSRLLRFLTLASAGVMAASVAARAQTGNIDIPAEDLKAALDSYISQSGVELVYKADDIMGEQSRAVHGALSPEQALDRLLEGTDVVAQRGPTGAVVLVRQIKGGIGPPGDSPSSGIVETVVVTGSRVIQDAENSPTPLTMISADQLRATTPSTIADALNKLPAFVGSSSQRTAGSASSNSGGDFLNLRNFGQQRTLVLLDGMRVPASNANGSVDVSTLPEMLVSRVDTVTAGASAVYGADAITGVVNFILDKNFTGVKYQANAGLSTYADGASYQLGVAAGTSVFGGRGHLEGEFFYNHEDEVQKQARPGGAANWSSYGLGTPASPFTNIADGTLNTESFGGKITCTNCSVNGQQFISNDAIGSFNPGIVTTPGGSVSGGGDGVFVTDTSAIGAVTREESFGRFSYNLNDNTVFFAQFTGAQARVFNHFFPSQIDNGRLTHQYYKNNPFLPASQQALLGDDSATDPNWATDGSDIFTMQKWIVPDINGEPIRATNSTTRNLTFSTGVSGQVFGNYNWNFHYTHGESRDSIMGINNGNNQFHDAQQDVAVQNGQVMCYNDTATAIALYGNIYPGCVPLNAFGPTAIAPAAYAYWSRTTSSVLTNKLDDIVGDISGNIFGLPAGPIRAALSGEMRWLGYIVNSDASPTATVNCYGLRLCGGTTQTLWDNNTNASVRANEDVWELSAEANIPILKDIPFIQSLSSDVAGRYTDYSVSGAVETWKIGIDWRINDAFRIRGTTSVDIRAPTLNDLYSPVTSTSVGYFDLLTNSSGTGTQQVSHGNANLVPEVSRTYSAGIVYTPIHIPGLTVSADFYNINLKNAITSVSATNPQVETLCNNSGGTSPFCALYIRPINAASTAPGNYPTQVISENLNSAFQATEGEDYELDYHFDAADVDSDLAGLINLSAFVNVQPKIDQTTFPNAQVQHNAGAGGTTATPHGHAALFGGYTLGNWSVNGQVTWYSDEFKNGLLTTPQIYAQPRVPSFSTEDITITRKIIFDNGPVMNLYVTVNNIANAQPPIVTGSSANPGTGIPVPIGEDVMGRTFTIGFRGNL